MGMGRFLESEKERLSIFKSTSNYFSEDAREDGVYKGKPRPFCLPRSYSGENVYTGIREEVIEYFTNYEINWHDAIDRKPSNHLCDSQVCCVNFLYPFAYEPEALRELLFPLFPNIKRVIPMEQKGQYLSIEWIGLENYLGEKQPGPGKRTRGANFTSADAAVMFQRTDGQRQIVLIEWKYTESYSGASLKKAKSGTDRTKIYEHLYERDDFPIDKALLPSFDDLFYEPFYQFMRQQLLAHEMERAKELGANIVSLLHIAPNHNQEFQRVTSPKLSSIGESVIDVWKKLQRPPHRFDSVSTEDLFGGFSIRQFPEMTEWWEYITARYSWLDTD
jgi:hypothetical protein